MMKTESPHPLDIRLPGTQAELNQRQNSIENKVAASNDIQAEALRTMIKNQEGNGKQPTNVPNFLDRHDQSPHILVPGSSSHEATFISIEEEGFLPMRSLSFID
jgi:hypothetical protein